MLNNDMKSGYVAFYKGKRIEVRAETILEARNMAAQIFAAKKAWQVVVALAEKAGKQVTHIASN